MMNFSATKVGLEDLPLKRAATSYKEMMEMKKKFFYTLLFIMMLGLLVSCTKKEDKQEQSQAELKTEVYSNLLDEKSRAYVREALEKAGTPAKDVEMFFGQVDDFNRSVHAYGLVKDGFEETLKLEADYDPYKMQDLWDAENPEFMGYNCRITSYSLLKSQIDVGEYEKESSNILIFDEISIEKGPDNIFNQNEKEGFRTLYHAINTEDTKDLGVHLKNVKDYWKSRKLSFKNKNASLISVFFHEEEGYLFIGHVGVLVPDIDGHLIFIEKIAFQEPYQAIRFKDRNRLNEYLMKKYNHSLGQETIPPFIMENDKLMEGYKVISNP